MHQNLKSFQQTLKPFQHSLLVVQHGLPELYTVQISVSVWKPNKQSGKLICRIAIIKDDCLTGRGSCSNPVHNQCKSMKKISVLIAMICVVFSLSGFAQFKITGNGNVGINTLLPTYKLDINSMETRSYYSGRNALHINHNGLDPRLCSNDRIVFYKLDGTGFAKLECQSYLQPSDGETMENVVSLENKGIAMISNLRGLSFNFKDDKLKRKETGFMAQELELVIPEAVFTNDSTKRKSLVYNSIIPYLVEAIKEQQIQIDNLKNTVGLITESQKVLKSNDFGTKIARLDQNIPNPFTNETRIGCFIPDNANSSFIITFNVNGTQLQSYNIAGKGDQVATIDATGFMPGMFFYSLFVDGKIVDTKKMILTK